MFENLDEQNNTGNSMRLYNLINPTKMAERESSPGISPAKKTNTV